MHRVIVIVIIYLDQKKKRGQVVKINKELWISYKGPSEKQQLPCCCQQQIAFPPKCDCPTGRCYEPIDEEGS